MRVWCRTVTDEMPSSINVATAAIGFKTLGADVTHYTQIDDILDCISRNDIVVDGVKQLSRVFNSMDIKRTTSDYPVVLRPFLHRKIWTDTIGHLRREGTCSVFIKPIEEKLFSGKIINSILDWASLVNVSLSQEVYCSQIVDIRSEYRIFIRYDRILDIRPYHGDYHFQYDPTQVDAILQAFTSWDNRPNSCAVDIAVTGDQKTIFLEFNDAYAIGAYGLEPSVYARFLTSRWTQLMNVPDPYATNDFEI